MNQFQVISVKIKPYLPIVTCIFLGFLTSILSINFSKDSVGYHLIFDNTIAKTWVCVLDDFSLVKEYLFEIMVYVFGNGLGFAASMTLMTVFFLTIKLKYLGKITGDFYLGTFFYTCFYLLLLEGTAIRVAFALALVMVAIYYLKQQQFWKCLLLILLGTQIHLTVILFLLVFPIYFIPRASWVVCLLFFTAPLCVIFDFSIFSAVIQFLGLINPKYLNYDSAKLISGQNSTGLFFPYIGFFSLLLGAIYLYLREKISADRFIKAMFLICLTGIALMWLFYDHVAMAARLGELLLLPIVILLSALDMELRSRQLFFERGIVYAISLSYFLARFYYLYIR